MRSLQTSFSTSAIPITFKFSFSFVFYFLRLSYNSDPLLIYIQGKTCSHSSAIQFVCYCGKFWAQISFAIFVFRRTCRSFVSSSARYTVRDLRVSLTSWNLLKSKQRDTPKSLSSPLYLVLWSDNRFESLGRRRCVKPSGPHRCLHTWKVRLPWSVNFLPSLRRTCDHLFILDDRSLFLIDGQLQWQEKEERNDLWSYGTAASEQSVPFSFLRCVLPIGCGTRNYWSYLGFIWGFNAEQALQNHIVFMFSQYFNKMNPSFMESICRAIYDVENGNLNWKRLK